MTIKKLRVHIAPVGFEIDRIVLPAIDMRADKIWLLVHNDSNTDRAKPCEDAIKKAFKKEKIQFEEIRSNRKDIFKILQSVKQIIQLEKDNDLYLNVSSGSKIQAIACTMACMMFSDKENLTPYYAEPEQYPSSKEKQQSLGLRNIIELPKYQIQIPKKELVSALKIIKDYDGKIQKKTMAELAEKEGLITINAKDNLDQVRFTSLDKNIIQPLKDHWNFIDVEKIGRTRWVKLNQEGSNAIEFLI